MRYRTEQMSSILTNEMAQTIIDYVSPIYGNSYVGLWLFQAIGTAMSQVYDLAESLRYETNPSTATLMLDYWESHYGLTKDSTLTIEQRRARIIAKTQSRGPCNPTVLAAAISGAIGGLPVDITERVAKNTFMVNIREYIEDITPVVAILERMKPAHLIYQIRVATKMVSNADIKIAIALTHAESYNVEVNS